MTLFFAMLAVLAGVVSVSALLSVVLGDRLGVWAAIQPLAVESAAAIAVTATVGSLYLSEVRDFNPCRLCWVQRGFMYPAAVALVAGVVTGRRWPVMAGGALAAVGLPVAIYHRYDQAVGGSGGLCAAENPCSMRWLEHFGFMTIPTMAGFGFLAIAILVGLHVWSQSGADRKPLPNQLGQHGPEGADL